MKNEELKSAEEWIEVGIKIAKQLESLPLKDSAVHEKTSIEYATKFIKAIQLNAIKHGMTLAAKIIEDGWEPPMQHDPHPPMTNAILTARDNLTL